MNIFKRFARWLGFDVHGNPPTYTGDDQARRSMYPHLTDEEYNSRFHPDLVKRALKNADEPRKR